MSEDDKDFSVWGFVKGFGKLLIGVLLLLQGIIGLVVMLMIVGVIVSVSNGFAGGGGGEGPSIPKEAALLINPNGVLVEQAELVDPFEQAISEAYGASEPQQIEVHDLARAIRAGATDDRIKGLVLDLGQLAVPTISASKIHFLSEEIKKFKDSGKPVYAVADYYTQEQYLLAANADKIYMHDKGSLVLIGYGSYGTYLKTFLEKMLVTPHVFRVGTFKAAVEPFIRDDMSPEAKEANAAFLAVLWRNYARSVEKARGLPQGSVANFADNYNEALRNAEGDFALAALKANLIDELKSRPDQIEALKEVFGEDKDNETFKNVEFGRYLASLKEKDDGAKPNVAVVTVAGTIIDGEAPAGVAAGGDTIAGYLKKALDDDDVKAVVLRVDSGGGSAFASEIIRDGVIALKKAGKPVVVSMGSLAASGGYWVAAPADEIWAAPTTVTGSIGIFAFFPTFEKAAERWGVTIDGVGTSALSSFYATGLGPLEENVADIFQQSVEKGYRDFLDVVADGRGLDANYVDQVGQGRVWIGEKALDLKLVDKIGGLDAAVAAAAKRAGLEDYDRVEMIEEVSPFQIFFGQASAKIMALTGVTEARARKRQSVISRIVAGVEKEAAFFAEFNDPGDLYARCIVCAR